MKKVLILVAVVVALVVGYYFIKKATTKTGANPLVTPTPPIQPTGTVKLYNVDSGEGLAAITAQVSNLATSGEYQRQLTKINPDAIFAGLTSRSAFAEMGGVSRIGWPLSPEQVTLLLDTTKAVPDAAGFTESAKRLNKINQLFSDNNLPIFLIPPVKDNTTKTFAENWLAANYPGGPSGWGAGGRKDQYFKLMPAAFGDLNKVAANILEIQSKMDKMVKDKAIADLRATGWKFLGYDAPQ